MRYAALVLMLGVLSACVGQIPDHDRDGFSEADGDCDDNDPARFPTNPEVCNEIDDDCDGLADNIDEDGDGVGFCFGDCADQSVDVFPDHPEDCDGIDNNCDGAIDEGFDGDGDGYYSGPGCEEHFGTSDCNDADGAINPGAVEVCDDIDNNCDGAIDEGLSVDSDNDGYSAPGSCGGDGDDCNDGNALIHPGATEECDPPNVDWDCDGIAGGADADGDGVPQCQGDCDDTSALAYPGGEELCDGLDNNCNLLFDEGFDIDGDGYVPCVDDCNDDDIAINPGADEACDLVDNDCDTLIDEDFDADADGVSTCADPVPDCDDDNASVFPGAAEICDGLDNNCSFQIDEGFDLDFDGWAPCVGDCNDENPAINPGAEELCGNDVDDDCDTIVDEGFDLDSDGFSECDGDCDDEDASVYPGGPEICDGLDNNCDGVPDETFDTDNDGVSTCADPPDCNDNVATVFPGALESCDGYDSDCNGFVPPVESDTDGDGQPICAGDCDDNDNTVFVDNIETCDAADNNCNGLTDEDFDVDGDGVTTCGADGVPGNSDDDCDDNDDNNAGPFVETCDAADNDCDGDVDEDFDLDGDGVTTCGPDLIFGNGDDDCDDNDDTSYPGAVQTCTSADNDCDGIAGDVDGDNDGSLICEDCEDDDPLIYPGAGFIECDGSDWDCDGIPETELVVAFLPGQVASWLDLPALIDLEAESASLGSCALTFVDIAVVTEANLEAAGAHVALLSSPGESCAATYAASERAELEDWLSGQGRGIVITGTVGTDGCQPYNDRYELATLAGVTLATVDPGTAVEPDMTRASGVFWTDIPGVTLSLGAAMVGDRVLGTCTGATVDSLVGNATVEPIRQVIAYTANPSSPCLAGVPMDHKGAWLPFQPEDGGDATERQLLYNVLDWLKE